MVPSITNHVDVYCDNNGAIAQAKEPRSHQRSKHILRRYHLIREIIERGDVKIGRVPTDDNVADPLTKPLPQAKHDRHARFIGIRYIDEWAYRKWEIVSNSALGLLYGHGIVTIYENLLL